MTLKKLFIHSIFYSFYDETIDDLFKFSEHKKNNLM